MTTRTVEVKLGSQTLRVVGEYSPEEPMVRYFADGSGYPGSPAEFTAGKVELKIYDPIKIDGFPGLDTLAYRIQWADVTALLDGLEGRDEAYHQIETLALDALIEEAGDGPE